MPAAADLFGISQPTRIGHWKSWKILATGYRGRLTELANLIRIVTTLEHYRLDWAPHLITLHVSRGYGDLATRSLGRGPLLNGFGY